MKEIKYLFVLCLFSLISIGASGEVVNGSCGTNLTWSYDTETTVLTIEGSGEMYEYGHEWDNEGDRTGAPWGSFYRDITSLSVGNEVTSIGSYAFYNCTSLACVDLSACTSIGECAFWNCTSLASVGDLSACTSIGGGAFSGCTSLASVGDLSACTSIGSSAFGDCTSLASVGDLSACTSIGSSAFCDCTSLASVGDLSVCTIIKEHAFSGCTSLVSVGDLSACTSIGDGAFSGCTSLASVGDLSACTSIGDGAFSGCTSLASVGDLSACTSIEGGAFSGCTSLASVGDLSACTSIRVSAFQSCTTLTSVDLPACTSIGYNAFNGCTSLASVGDLSACTSIGFDAFYNCISLASVGDLSACISIERSVFSGCTSLASVGDLSACTSIGESAFSGCTSLTSVGDLSACTSIGDYAFLSCTSLTSVGDLSACTSIGNNAFENCTSLASVGDLSACTSIESFAFYNCTSLASVGDLSACTSIKEHAFHGCTALASVGDLSACTSIGSGAFFYCSSLASVGDLSACTSIGGGAFSDCSSLASVGALSACTSIGSDAFYYCSSLASVGDLSACTSIGSGAFRNCPVSNITIGDATVLADGSTNTIPVCMTVLVPDDKVEAYRTAENWSNLAERIISKDAQNDFSIEITETPSTGSAVQNAIEAAEGELANVMTLKVTGDINAYDIFVMRNKMPNLHSIDLSDANIKATADGYKYYSYHTTEENVFPQYAFYQQYKLTRIKFPKTITSIGYNCCDDCQNIINVEMFEGVKSIGSYAFHYCSKIQSLTIPSGCETIDGCAFRECYSLKNVSLPNTLTKIYDSVFDYCNKLESINLPSSLTYIDFLAFYCCFSLSEITLPAALTYIGSSAFAGCSNLKTVKATAVEPSSVTMSDDSFDNYANKTLYVPYDEETGWEVTRDAYYWNTQWGQFGTLATWKPTYDYVNISGDYDQDKGTIPGTDIDADLGDEAGYQVGDKGKQDFDDVHVKNDGEGSGASIIVDDKGELTVKKLFSDITVSANRWYFFCFPFNVKLADIVVPAGSSYVFRTYDGAKRAENGSGGWVNLDNEVTTLTAGKGYIFQCNIAGTLSIPVDNPDFTADGKSPELEAHTASNKQDANWNFVGNPYLSYYELEDLGHDAPVTYWNGSGYTAVRPGDDDYAIQPYQAFFVQKTDTKSEVTFDKDKRETYKQSQSKAGEAKARRAKAMVNKERMLVNVELSDGTNSDKTRVVFNDKQQMDYETECDASKFMSTEAVPQLYSIYNKVNYAINERPNGNGEVQLGFKVPADGSYTISVARMDTPMLLRDTETGTVFDFKYGSYTFDAQAGTNTTRFVLVKKDNVTAISPVVGTEGESASYYDINGQKTTSAAPGIKIIKENGSVKKMLVK